MAVAGNSGNVANARTLFETLVDGALQQQRSQGAWERFARRYDGTGSRKIQITAVGATPDYEEWEGDKNFRGFRKLTTSVPFKKYHKSIDLQREEVVHDMDGSTAVALRAHAQDVGYIYDKIVFDKLKANPTVADGTALIADTHNYGTYDNKTTSALNFDTFDSGRATMRAQTDEWGEYLNIEPDTLLVHPDEERIALEIAQADSRPVSVGTGGEVSINGSGLGATSMMHVYRGLVTVVVTPRWTSGDWLLMDSRYPPIALGVWRDPEVHVQDAMDSDERFRRDRFAYSVEADLNAAGLTHHGCYGKIT